MNYIDDDGEMIHCSELATKDIDENILKLFNDPTILKTFKIEKKESVEDLLKFYNEWPDFNWLTVKLIDANGASIMGLIVYKLLPLIPGKTNITMSVNIHDHYRSMTHSRETIKDFMKYINYRYDKVDDLFIQVHISDPYTKSICEVDNYGLVVSSTGVYDIYVKKFFLEPDNKKKPNIFQKIINFIMGRD